MKVCYSNAVIELTPEECLQARGHWLALMASPSTQSLALARETLQAAPSHVQKAVTSAMVDFWRAKGRNTEGQTPFDDTIKAHA